jgi:hypothetical protein
MRQILLFISTLLFFAIVLTYFAHAAEVTLTWTYPDDQPIDGFKIFYRASGSPFNYSTPAATVAADLRQVKVTVPGIDGKITTYAFAARAFRGTKESEDSNTCETIIDLMGIAPPGDLKCFIDATK